MGADPKGRNAGEDLSAADKALCEAGTELLLQQGKMPMGLSVVDFLYGRRRSVRGSKSKPDN